MTNPRVKTDNSISNLRLDFPILDSIINDKKLAYLDSAATTHKPKQVIEAMSEFMLKSNGTVRRGVYDLSVQSTQAFDAVREQIRAFINAKSTSEIIFTRGTTEAINLVAYSFTEWLRLGQKPINDTRSINTDNQAQGQGYQILISGLEHHANIVPWQIHCQRVGLELKVIPVLDNGELDQEAYAELISSGKVKLLALTHISNAIGTINPIQEMIMLAHKHRAAVLIDGAQAAAHTKINIQELDADFYVFSGHKAYGPTGVGVLYAKSSYLEALPPYHGGGEMIEKVSFSGTSFNKAPFKFEAGTPAIVEVIGLGEAIKYIETIGLDWIAEQEHNLRMHAEEKLQEIPGLKIIGTSKHKAAITSFVFDDIGSYDIGTMLNEYGIAIRTGHHCAQPVMERFGVDSTSRISIGFYNNVDDIDRCIEALTKAVKIFR